MNGKHYVVRTTARLTCEAERAWNKVCFYEHIAIRPSWLLRTVLPVPLRTTGAYSAVGNVSRCLYSDGGYLTKRIRRIDVGRRIDFDIIEQTIRYAGRIALKGGTIRIEPGDDGTCSVEMTTHYELRSPLVSAVRFFIDHVVGAMHRIVIRDMRERLGARQGALVMDDAPRERVTDFDVKLEPSLLDGFVRVHAQAKPQR
jgi:hypothetical protein